MFEYVDIFFLLFANNHNILRNVFKENVFILLHTLKLRQVSFI